MIILLIITFLIILVLALIILFLLRKFLFLSKNEYEFITFVIDLYIKYGEDLDIFPNDKTKERVISELNKIKEKIEKYLKKNLFI